MRLGLSSYSYGWAVGVPGSEPEQPMTAVDLLDRARAFGIGVVQIADNLPLHTLTDTERLELGQRADTLGIQIEVGTRGIAPQVLEEYLRIAVLFGSGILRTVIDTAAHHPDADEVVATLRPLMPVFERGGVVLAIENHDRFPALTLREIIERVGSPALGICLDTANSLGAQEGVAYVGETLAPYIVNLHIKDFSIRRLSHFMGFIVEGQPAGGGDLQIPPLLEFIRNRVPRPVNAILELWPPPERTLEATLAKEAEWVESSVRYLRQLI